MYLLDTNICIYLMKKKFPNLQAKIKTLGFDDLSLSAITLAELEYGVAKSQYPQKNRELLYVFIAPFKTFAFSQEDAENFGIIRSYLNKQGTPIGPYDLQIAAQCLSRDLCLITNNVKEFARIPQLKIENWIE